MVANFYLKNCPEVKHQQLQIHGAQFKIGKYSKRCHSTDKEDTEMCNTAIEREFCGLSRDSYENCQKLCYEA